MVLYLKFSLYFLGSGQTGLSRCLHQIFDFGLLGFLVLDKVFSGCSSHQLLVFSPLLLFFKRQSLLGCESVTV